MTDRVTVKVTLASIRITKTTDVLKRDTGMDSIARWRFRWTIEHCRKIFLWLGCGAEQYAETLVEAH